MDWTERDYSEVKPGAIIQHYKTMRYAEVVEEPDADTVQVRNTEGAQTWKLRDLMWYRKTGAAAIYGGAV